MMTYKPNKLGQTDLVLVCDQSSSVGVAGGALGARAPPPPRAEKKIGRNL